MKKKNIIDLLVRKFNYLTNGKMRVFALRNIEILNKKLKVEMDAKNRAYFFILSHGYFNEFYEFCKINHSDNPHKDCVLFMSESSDKKIE